MKSNPAAGMKRVTEPRESEIVYCTPSERTEIIAKAKATKNTEWLAVPIAFYSGMRREEVARLEWQDVRFTEGLLVVRITKTKKSQIIPINAKLETLLKKIPTTKRIGYVVPIPDGIDRLWKMDNLLRTLQSEKRTALWKGWNIPRPPPSKKESYKDDKAAWLLAKAEKDRELESIVKRIGWNSFRHTFGSLLAQSGVSIDKISAWMGNTPEVCRRHYAQFVPREKRDEEIDKL